MLSIYVYLSHWRNIYGMEFDLKLTDHILVGLFLNFQVRNIDIWLLDWFAFHFNSCSGADQTKVQPLMDTNSCSSTHVTRLLVCLSGFTGIGITGSDLKS